ncbi:MAG: DUF4199 domain-containing protein [Bacteroidetes bacterium]|nr:DUF4199 domain-containing protein [Bacteroidota bacterium]
MKITLNIKLGIAAGIINCIAWYAFAKSLGFYSLNIEQYRYYVTLLLLFSGIFLSVYLTRKSQAGFIDFKDAVKCGILYTVVLALILAIFNYIYYKFIATDSIDYFLNDARQLMEKDKLKEEDILKTIETIKTYFGSFRMFMSTLILGVLVSLLAGAVLRKKKLVIPFSEN